MKLLSIGEFSIYLLYPLLMPIARILNNKTTSVFKVKEYSEYPFVIISLMFLSEILGGSIYFIQVFFLNPKKLASTSLASSVSLNNTLTQIINENTTIGITKIQAKTGKYTLKTFLFIFVFALIDLIGSVAFTSVGTPEFNYLMISVQIFLYAYLSVKILKYKVYYHHYVSMILIVIGVVIINIYIDLGDILWYWIFLSFLCQLMYGIKFTGNKWLMLSSRFDPLLMLFYEGVFGFVVSLLILLGLYVYCGYDPVNSQCKNLMYFGQFSLNDLYYLMLFTVCTGILNIFVFQTNYLFMPTLLVIGNVLSSFLDWVVSSIMKNELFPLALVGYIVVILGTMLYTELIILHFWKMDYYTKIAIRKRSRLETVANNQELLELIVD